MPNKAGDKVEAFLRDELFGGVSNAEITGFEGENSLEDKIYQKPRTRRKRLLSPFQVTYRIRRIRFAYMVRRWLDLDPRLPAPQNVVQRPDLRDVYLITRADTLNYVVAQSLHHWSIYCDGYVYHLSAQSQSGSNKINHSGISPNRRPTHDDTTELKYGNYNYVRGHDWSADNVVPGRPLVAYHIGQTDLQHGEVLAIARWIIGKISLYDYLRSNCQHFAMSLCVRILCRRRSLTVFMGTLQQIASWDARCKEGRTGEHEDGYSSGFLLCSPEGMYTPAEISTL